VADYLLHSRQLQNISYSKRFLFFKLLILIIPSVNVEQQLRPVRLLSFIVTYYRKSFIIIMIDRHEAGSYLRSATSAE